MKRAPSEQEDFMKENFEEDLKIPEERAYENVDEKLDPDEDFTGNQNLSDEQKHLIYSMISDGFCEDPERYINLVKKINLFTKDQAQAFIECLKMSKHIKIHKELSSRILSFIAELCIHPADIDGCNELKNNEHVKGHIGDWVGQFLSYFGKLSLLPILFLYSASSYYKVRLEQKKNERAPSSAFSNVDMREESNGKNNPLG